MTVDEKELQLFREAIRQQGETLRQIEKWTRWTAHWTAIVAWVVIAGVALMLFGLLASI